MGWRLILDGPRGAAENMAVDEAILRACAEGRVPPTVRIYSWKRPSISLGCLQAIAHGAGFDLDYCQAEGIEVVRRMTGGRAVIHGSDVTFSMAIREADLPEGCTSVIASHRWLMGGVVAGLTRLGIDAEIGAADRSGGSPSPPGPRRRSDATDASTDCFAHVAQCDVRIGSTKAVGSAQARRFGALLEQGSIPYEQPGFDARRVFGRRAVSCPICEFSYSVIAAALVKGFTELVGKIAQQPLTDWESETALELARDVYSTSEWTETRTRLAY
jgi:lipoate-protein ligase A